MKSLVAPLEPFLDERAKHPVLLVETIEKSANVTLLAKHAISHMDGTFITSHDGPPREWTFRPPPAGHFVNGNLERYEVKRSFCAKFAQSFARHDPGGTACASSSVDVAISVQPRIASTNQSEDAA
jgi:hypothetical protein